MKTTARVQHTQETMEHIRIRNETKMKIWKKAKTWTLKQRQTRYFNMFTVINFSIP